MGTSCLGWGMRGIGFSGRFDLGPRWTGRGTRPSFVTASPGGNADPHRYAGLRLTTEGHVPLPFRRAASDRFTLWEGRFVAEPGGTAGSRRDTERGSGAANEALIP